MKQLNPETNHLYPVFLKLEHLQVLLVGGGNVAVEKLDSILSNSPQTKIKIVAKKVQQEIYSLKVTFPNIEIIEKEFDADDLNGIQIAVIAIDDYNVSEEIAQKAKQRKILVNVADKPSLCDFYLGSIVKKGNLKIAISTNGKSPTIAKRLREILTENLPDEMDEILNKMQKIREGLKGDFKNKVQVLNKLTTDFLN